MDNNEKKKAFHETLAELIEYATGFRKPCNQRGRTALFPGSGYG